VLSSSSSEDTLPPTPRLTILSELERKRGGEVREGGREGGRERGREGGRASERRISIAIHVYTDDKSTYSLLIYQTYDVFGFSSPLCKKY
jgi:hypothetical protein